MNTHEIKLRREFVEPILKRKKTFEIRKNDRGYQVGDKIRFTVVTENGNPAIKDDDVAYLESREFTITYVIGGWGIKDGYVVFGIEPVPIWKEAQALRYLRSSGYSEEQIDFIVESLRPKGERIGHWIEGDSIIKCSECGSLADSYTDYCPYCGAKMEV